LTDTTQPAGRTVTKADLDREIISEHYSTAEDGAMAAWRKRSSASIGDAYPEQVFGEGKPLSRVVFCVMVLRNGYTVTGQAAKVDPVGFDLEVGERIARADAVEKLWPLLGFRLADKIAAAGAPS
jgi:hypothetical protein